MKLIELESKKYSWLKNSDFYTSLNHEDLENDLEIIYCSIYTEDINLFLNVSDIWCVNYLPSNFFDLLLKTKPIKKLEEMYERNKSEKIKFLISLLDLSLFDICSLSTQYLPGTYNDFLDYSNSLIYIIFENLLEKHYLFIYNINKNPNFYPVGLLQFLKIINTDDEELKQKNLMEICGTIEIILIKLETYTSYTSPEYFNLIERIHKFLIMTINSGKLIFKYSRMGQLYAPDYYRPYNDKIKNIKEYFEDI